MKRTIQKVRALTKSQLMIWTGQQLAPESPMYNMAMIYQINDSIDSMAFREAFAALVQETEALRMVVRLDEDTPMQYLYDGIGYELVELDFSGEMAPRAALQAWAQARSLEQFDLSVCLFDTALIKLSDTQYAWYFNQHHLLTDGWSLTVIYKRMSALYELAKEGRLKEAEAQPSYFDFIEKEHKSRHSDTFNKADDYWQNRLDSLSEIPKLYGTSGAQSTGVAKRVLVDLGAARSEAIKALATTAELRAFTTHLSLFNIFATVLYAYLHRVSGQEEIVVGTPSHNRTTSAFQQTAGMFIEIFPMQVEVDASASWMDLFKQVRGEANQYFRHAKLGRSTANLSGSFNVLYNYIAGTFGDFVGMAMESDWLLPDSIDSAHHLRLQVHDFDNTGSIKLHFDMNTDVFDEATRANASQHFLSLLDAFIADRTQAIGATAILSEAEHKRVVYDFNDTQKAFAPAHQNLLTLFEQQVQLTPKSTALNCENRLWSYQAFNERANQLGHYLQKEQIGKEEVVAIIMERALEMPLAIYGILKAGAAFLPIDPNTPMERIRFILKDAGVKKVLTQEKWLQQVKACAANCIALDSEWHLVDTHSKEAVVANIAQNDLAYVIYTSGSTGKPKGVMVEHRHIVNRLNWIKDITPLNQSDVYLQKTPYTFDVAVPEFFAPLQVGASLVMAKPEGHKDPAYLVAAIAAYGITTIHFVPSMLSVFLERKDLNKCATLKRVYASGEAISMSLQNRFFDQFDIELHNLYGPTEAAVEVTRWQCQPNDTGLLVPIGVPVANTQIYILDEYLNPVPQGATGELYIAGVQVARGYLNRPTLTAERFVDDPFSATANAKMYRSGDLARHRADGVIEYLGRTDYQVKLRGFRVELGEIEAIIEAQTGVNQAVVVMHEQQLVAYYTGTGADLEISLSHHLAMQLPAYMIPNTFVYLAEIPLGTSGKVNRKALPKPTQVAPTQTSNYVAPSNDVETLLVEMWEEVLQVSPIGVQDDFLQIGGHSLTAIRITSRINEMLDLSLPINLVFEKKNIQAYGAHIESTIATLMAEMEANAGNE